MHAHAPENSLDSCEQTGRLLDKAGENELKAAAVKLGHDIQRLRVATQT